jgi:hypothetical protein
MLKFLKRATNPPTPETGKVTFFVDTNGLPKVINEAGVVSNFVGPQGLKGDTGNTGTPGTNGTTPTNQVTTDSTQTGLVGDKTSSGKWLFKRVEVTDITDATGGIWDGPNRVYSDSNPPGTFSQMETVSEPATPANGFGVQYVLGDGIPRYKSDTGITYRMSRSTGDSTVNVLDYGADMSGTNASDAALDAAIAALPGGGNVIIPAGTLRLARAPYIVAANNITITGAGFNCCVIKTNATTGDQLRLTGYGCQIFGVSIQGPGNGTTSQKTSGIGLDIQSVEGYASECSFAYQYDSLQISGTLVDVKGIYCRYFTHSGIVVNQNSDHRISDVTMVNNAATLPTGAGIDVQNTASLVMDRLNIISSNFALNISPAAGVTIPSVKAVNCFFDTSAVGLNMQGAGAVFRSEFTNCWFSSMSIAGVRMQPAAGGSVDGITFVNCDLYNNVAGTTTGMLAHGGAGSVGKWKMVGCSVAGWTVGVQLNPGAAHFPTIMSNTIGAVSAFAVNTTGVAIAAGTYKGIVLAQNDVMDNTTNFSLGVLTVTTTTAASHRIIDNAGINPRGAVTAPAATPTSATVFTNLTGFRVNVIYKAGTTAPTAIAVNGIATVLPAASQIVPFLLEPGGTITITGTVGTWTWVGQ